MAITMRDRFLVRAPIEDVWRFLLDPHHVASCMPGAHVDHIESDRAFRGSIKVAVGPFSTSYKGRVECVEIDDASYTARLRATGHERGGGSAHGSMVSSLTTVDEGTEVVVDISVVGTSKLVQMGLGLTGNLAHVLFEQFVSCVKERLETPQAETFSASKPAQSAPVQVIPLMAKAFMRSLRTKRSPR